MPYKGARKQPWVVNDKLVVDPAMEQFMDMCKTLHDENLDGRVGQWSEGWFAGMKGTLKDEKGNPVEVFCYLLPTWGLHYVLKQNSPDTAGDWATDDTFLTAYAKSSGDTVGNLNVQNALKDSFSDPYLAGQNHYKEFCEMAKGIDGSLIQGTDQQIEALFNEATAAYANGEKTKEQALKDFKDQVSSTMGY